MPENIRDKYFEGFKLYATLMQVLECDSASRVGTTSSIFWKDIVNYPLDVGCPTLDTPLLKTKQKVPRMRY